MKLIYNFENGKLHEVCGNPEYETEEFEYEAKNTKSVIEEEFMNEFGTNLIQTREIIDELNLNEELEERYEEEIKEHFKEQALKKYKQKCGDYYE